VNSVNRRDFIKKGILAGALFSVSPFRLGNLLANNTQTRRKIFVFSKHLQWLDYQDMAKMAAQIGFDGVDITVRPKGHVLPENAARDLPGAVEAVRKQGLIADTITTAFTNINNPYTEMIIKTAAKLGIKQYRMGWMKYDADLDIPENLKNFEHQLQELSQMNAHYNIRGDYQNHAGTSFGATIWDAWNVLKKLDSQWLGFRYDIRHAVVEGAKSWPLTLKTIAPYVRSLDIKDFKWSNNSSDPVINTPVGEGFVDFQKYVELLTDYNIMGNMTMHFEYPLGGAENGHRDLTVNPEVVINAMKKDLAILKGFLKHENQ